MSEKKDPNAEISIDPELVDEALHAVTDGDETPKADPERPEKEEVDYKDRLIRLTADFDNYRKRIVKEKSEYIKYGNEHLLKEMLPIIDNFERALQAENNADAASILKGVEMIFVQLTQTLEKFGLKSESAKGQTFDPNLHDAMSNVTDPEVEPGTIVDEHQKLYRYHDKLIRPALVTVAQEASNSSEEDQEPDADPQEA